MLTMGTVFHPFVFLHQNNIRCPGYASGLPLGLLSIQESLQNANNILQSRQVCPQLGLDLCLVGSQLFVEHLAVWAGTHGGAEDRLDEEAVVGLERETIGVLERYRQLLGVGSHVLAQ